MERDGNDAESDSVIARHVPSQLLPGTVSRLVLATAVVVAVVAPALMLSGSNVPGRPLITIVFAVMIPGTPIASLLRVQNTLVRASMIVAVSLSCLLLVSNLTLVNSAWDPKAAVCGLAAASLIATYFAWPTATAPSLSGLRATVGARTWSRSRVVCVLILVAAMALFALETYWIKLGAATGLGVVGVIGWPYVVALVLIACVFAWQLRLPKLDNGALF